MLRVVLKLHSPKAIKHLSILAGLLTYSSFVPPSHPDQLRDSGFIEYFAQRFLVELTAAGLFRIYT